MRYSKGSYVANANVLSRLPQPATYDDRTEPFRLRNPDDIQAYTVHFSTQPSPSSPRTLLLGILSHSPDSNPSGGLLLSLQDFHDFRTCESCIYLPSATFPLASLVPDRASSKLAARNHFTPSFTLPPIDAPQSRPCPALMVVAYPDYPRESVLLPCHSAPSYTALPQPLTLIS